MQAPSSSPSATAETADDGNCGVGRSAQNDAGGSSTSVGDEPARLAFVERCKQILAEYDTTQV